MRAALAGCLVLLIALAGCFPAPESDPANEAAGAMRSTATITAIVGADAHTMSRLGRIENATILVRDSRIIAVGPDVSVPEGAQIIDAAGKTVTPGLMSSATYLGLVEVSSSLDTVDRSGAVTGLGASFDIRYGLNFNSVLIPVARADGLTHAIVMPSASSQTPFAGAGALINVGTDDNLLERPGIAMFAGIDGPSTAAPGRSRSSEWIVLRHALAEARDFGGPGDGGDSEPGLEAALRRADLKALWPVLDGSMPLVIRTKRESDIRQAVALGRDFGIKVILYEADEAWRAADLLAQNKVSVILDPTANLPRRFDDIGARLDAAAILHRAGVPLALHVPEFQMSHNAGQELRQAAGIAVANGLPWNAALEALTAGAARIWGVEDHIGKLEAGMIADLVVWSGDPFEMTTRPVTVMIDGHPMPLHTRQTLLRDRYLPIVVGAGSARRED